MLFETILSAISFNLKEIRVTCVIGFGRATKTTEMVVFKYKAGEKCND